MKKIVYSIFSIFLLILSVSSCQISSGDERPGSTLDCFLNAYRATSLSIQTKYLQVLDYSLKVDECVMAGETIQRDSLEDRYFPYYKLRVSPDRDTCYLLQRHQHMLTRILTRGTSLSQVGSKWTIINYSMSSSEPIWVDILNKGDGFYEITAKDNPHGENMYLEEITLEVFVSRLPDRYRDRNSIYDYAFVGQGNFINKDSERRTEYDVRIRFDIQDRMSAYMIQNNEYALAGDFRFYRGKMNIFIVSLDGSKKLNELLIVELDGPQNQPVLRLTYDGQTQEFI